MAEPTYSKVLSTSWWLSFGNFNTVRQAKTTDLIPFWLGVLGEKSEGEKYRKDQVSYRLNFSSLGH